MALEISMRYRKSYWGALVLLIGAALFRQTNQYDIPTTTDYYRQYQTELPTEINNETTDKTTDYTTPIQNNMNGDNISTDTTENNNRLLIETDVYNFKLSTKNDSTLTSVMTNAQQESSHLKPQLIEIENGTKSDITDSSIKDLGVTQQNINMILNDTNLDEQNLDSFKEKNILINDMTELDANETTSNQNLYDNNINNNNNNTDTETLLKNTDFHQTVIQKKIENNYNISSKEYLEENITTTETNESNSSQIWDFINDYFKNSNFSESEGIEHRLSPDLLLTISAEEEIFGAVQPREVEEAADYGLRMMNELVRVTEPQLYKHGLWIDREGPAGRVAAFSAPRPQVLTLAKYGYATLQASTKLLEQISSSDEGVETRQGGGSVSRLPAEVRESLRGTALHAECPVRPIPPCRPAARRYRTADGTCNNALHPRRGAALTPQQRFLPPHYQDGIQTIRRSVVNRSPLPSARLVSTRVHRERNVEAHSLTLMLMQWGQFIDHDLTATPQARAFNGSTPRCCTSGGQDFQPPEFMHPECLPIPVPVDDWFLGRFNIRCIEFIRSAPTPREECDFGYRQQLNQVTSYIDASTIYGSSVQQSDAMRVFRDGLLQYGRLDNRNPPDPPGGEVCRDGAVTTECFRPGDGRSSEQPALTALHISWVRKHNQLGTMLANMNRHWSDEKVYQETRRIVGAMVQHITYREFLPIVLGQEVMKLFDLQLLPKGYYISYEPKVNPTLANSFTAAAYRFGHSLVQNSFSRSDRFHRPLLNNVSLHEEQTNPANIWSFGSVDRLLLGMTSQPSQRRDEYLSDELTNHLFQPPGFPFGMDLAAINVQRGRDHGLAPYISWRAPCGLTPIKNWTDLHRVMSKETAQRFRSIYLNVEDIDLFSAGLAEKPVRGGIVGPTFACIIAQQFLNLRKGDRFWYENGKMESSFTPAQLQQIRRITFAQILCETMQEIDTLQPFVFLTSDNFRNKRQSCRDFDGFDLKPWIEQQTDLNEFTNTDNNIRFKRSERKRKRPNRRKTKPKPSTTEATVTNLNDEDGNLTKTKQITYYGTNTVTINQKPDRHTYYQTTKPNNYHEYLVTSRPTLSNNYFQDQLTLDMPNKQPNTPYIFSNIRKQVTTTPDYKLHIQVNYFYNTTDKPDLIIEKPGNYFDQNRPKPNTRPITSYNNYEPAAFDYNRPITYQNTRPISNKKPTTFDYLYNRPQTTFDYNTAQPYRPTFDQNPNNYDSKPLYYDVITNKRPHDYYNLNNAQTYGLNLNKYSTKYPHNVATSNPITILDTKPAIHLKPQTIPTKRPNIYIIESDNSYNYHSTSNTNKYRPSNFDYIRPTDTQVYRRPVSAHITKLNTKPVVIFARPQLSKQDEYDDNTEIKYNQDYMDYPKDRQPTDATIINIDHTIKLANNTKYVQILTFTNISTTPEPIEYDNIYVPVSKVKGYTTSTNSLNRVYVNVQQKEADDDLEMTYDDLMEVYTKPDEEFINGEEFEKGNSNTKWKIYNETIENSTLRMPEPSFSNELCSAELPKPMNLFIDDDLLLL